MAEKKTTRKPQKSPKKPKVVKEAKAGIVSPAVSRKTQFWNKVFAGLYAVQAVLLVVLAKSSSVPVTVSYPAVDTLATEATGHEVVASAYRHLFDVRVAWVLAVVLLIFAVGHILMATIYRKRYELDLQTGVNRWRWATLGLGGGVLLAVVGLLSGMQHIGLLLAVVLFSCLAGILVLLTERCIAHNGKNTQMEHVLCATSLIAAVFPWVVLIGGVAAAWMYNGKLPVYLCGVYAALLITAVASMFVTHYRLKAVGKWKNTLYTERVYALLALGGTALVVWQVYLGILH
jgi:hypothetical protein